MTGRRVIRDGDQVSVTIPRAEVMAYGNTQVQLRLPGGHVVHLPLRDERAEPVVELALAGPVVHPGQVWCPVGRPDVLLFAVDFTWRDDVGAVVLYDSSGRWGLPGDAEAKFGPLEQLTAASPGPAPWPVNTSHTTRVDRDMQTAVIPVAPELVRGYVDGGAGS